MVSELASCRASGGAEGSGNSVAGPARGGGHPVFRLLVLAALMGGGTGPALAKGGSGGAVTGDPVAQGGVSGAGDSATAYRSGGGGGGPGAAGGNNINGTGAGNAASGPGLDGGDGASDIVGTGVGGGGGGGGGNGAVLSSLANSGTLKGGKGGNGGNGNMYFGSGGGGGGAGGYGAIVTGASSNVNDGVITGGSGGNGGSGSGGGGGGGDGGVGILFTGLGAQLRNTGTISGGAGGNAGGSAIGPPASMGAGGEASVGAGLSIVNFGLIAGAGAGVTQANAITFIGGDNTLEIDGGSSISGAVLALGGGHNTLVLGAVTGSGAVFNASQIGQQYQGFNDFRVNGGNWSLTDATTAVTNWTLTSGTLNIAGDGALGSTSSQLTIDGATLQMGAAFTLDANRTISLGNANGTIDTNGFNATVAGGIGGTGGLTKTGAGTLVLTGVNSYTGGTTIEQGVLQIGDGGLLGTLVGPVTDNATLVFDHSNGVTLLDTVGGFGNLIKRGAGTLYLTGAKSYTGDTTVSAGILQFDSYGQSASNTLGIGVSGAGAGEYGRLQVSGTATLAANARIFVDVAGANTLAQNQTLAGVISAGTLNASTFDVTDNSALFNFRAVINNNAVDLHTSLAMTTSDAVGVSGSASALGASRVLDSVLQTGAGGDMANVVTALGSLGSQGGVARAVTQTLPLLDGGVTQSTLGMLGAFNRVLQNRIGGAGSLIGSADGISGVATGESAPDRHVWTKAFGSRADQDDRGGASGFSADSWGTAFGADSELAPGALLGISYAYANSCVDGNAALSGTSQHADIDSNVLAIYGSKALPNDMQLDFQADIGRSHTDGSRRIDFGGLNRTATSGYVTYSTHLGAGLSKDIAWTQRTTFTPAVRFDYTQLRAQGYSESGADALNLNVDGNTTRAFLLGAEGRLRYALTERSSLGVNLGAGYDAINDRGDLVSAYAGAPGQSFATPGIDHSPWLVNAGIGYAYEAKSGAQFILRYDVEGRAGYLNQTASVKGSWLF